MNFFVEVRDCSAGFNEARSFLRLRIIFNINFAGFDEVRSLTSVCLANIWIGVETQVSPAPIHQENMSQKVNIWLN